MKMFEFYLNADSRASDADLAAVVRNLGRLGLSVRVDQQGSVIAQAAEYEVEFPPRRLYKVRLPEQWHEVFVCYQHLHHLLAGALAGTAFTLEPEDA